MEAVRPRAVRWAPIEEGFGLLQSQWAKAANVAQGEMSDANGGAIPLRPLRKLCKVVFYFVGG